VFGHHDRVTRLKLQGLVLEEVIGVVKVNRFLPLLPGFLVTFQIRVVGDEDPGLGVSLGGLMGQGQGELSGSPVEVEYMRFEELPRLTQIFGDVELFVNLTWLAIIEVLAIGPSCS